MKKLENQEATQEVKEANQEFIIRDLESINSVAFATIGSSGKISVENAQHWLESVAKSFVVLDEKLVNETEEAYKRYITLEKEAINLIAVYMYDKIGVYSFIKGEFTKAFGMECKFTNKAILKEIIKATFSQFKGELSQDLSSIRDNSNLLLDLEFNKWIKELNGVKRADEGFISYIPRILRLAALVLNHNIADNKGVYPAKVYTHNGAILSKNALNDLIKSEEDISVIFAILEKSVKAYNDAYNINSRFNKALKGFDKEKLIELLGLITPDSVESLIKEYTPSEVA